MTILMNNSDGIGKAENVRDYHFLFKAGKQGTSVTATNLFGNIPVRKQYFKDINRRKDELKKTERYLTLKTWS